MSIQKKYSVIDNVNIVSGTLSFEVTANDNFNIVSIYYNNNERFEKALDDIDITANLTPTVNGDLNSGTLSIDLRDVLCTDCTNGVLETPFDEVLNIITVTTDEEEPTCTNCESDIYLFFDYESEMLLLAEKIISQYSVCECIDVTDCDLEKALLLELLNVQSQITPVGAGIEFYKRYKDYCCD